MIRGDRAGATRRAQRVRDGVTSINDVLDTLVEIQERQDWMALDYKSWSEYYEGEFGPDKLKLTPEERGRVIGALVAAGIPKRQLAKMLGVSEGAVRYQAKKGRAEQPEVRKSYAPPAIEPQVSESEPAENATAEPDPADVSAAMGQALTEVAGSVGAGVRLPAEFLRDALCGSPVDPTHCDACGSPISWPDQTGGHLRCLTCDPSSDHKAIPNGPDWLPECSYCATQTSAAVTADPTEDASPALGEPDVDELAASTSGTPSSGSEPVGTGLGSGELEERIEEEAASFSAPPLLPGVTPEDSPAADLDDVSQGVLQQSGPDSPTGREGGRSETNHHLPSGTGGVAPGSGSGQGKADPVEPVLEDGGEMPPELPSSSDPRDEPTATDRLLHALAELVEVLDEMDPEAMGPYLFPAELVLLHERADRIAEFVGRVGLARTQLAGTP